MSGQRIGQIMRTLLLSCAALSLVCTVGATDAPTSSPTSTSWGTVTKWGNDYATTFETIDSDLCTNQGIDGTTNLPICQAGKRFPDASEYYNLCYSLTGSIVPNAKTPSCTQAEIDADMLAPAGHSARIGCVTHIPSIFRIDTDPNRPGGCTIGTAANGEETLFFNQAGTGNCGDGASGNNPMCFCECQKATASPTSSPTLQGVNAATLDCIEMPDDQVGYSAGVGTEIAVLDFNRTDKRVKIQPYINWASTDLYHRDQDFHLSGYGAGGVRDNTVNTVDGNLPWPSVSAWVDFVKVRDFPYQELDDSRTNGCRFKLDHANEGHFPNEWIGEDCYDKADDMFNLGLTGSVNDGLPVWTNYSFYVATTICYTSLPPADCETDGIAGVGSTSTWQTDAYLYPTQFTAAYNHYIPDLDNAVDLDGDGVTDDDAHVATCRRTWQQVAMRVKYGAEVNIQDNLVLYSTSVVQLDDGSIEEPDSEETWQKYQDFGPQQVEQRHMNAMRFERETGDDTVSPAARKVIATQSVADWNAQVDDGGVYVQPKNITDGSLVAGVPLLNFGHRYIFDFEIKPGLKFNEFVDASIAEMVEAQYDRLQVTHTWERYEVLSQSWEAVTEDEYLIYGTDTSSDGYYSFADLTNDGTDNPTWNPNDSAAGTGVKAVLGNAAQEGTSANWKYDHHNFRPNGARDAEGRTCENYGHASYDAITCNHTPLGVTHFSVEGMIEKVDNTNVEDSVRLKLELLWSASSSSRRRLRGEYIAGVINARQLQEADPTPAPASSAESVVVEIRFTSGYESVLGGDDEDEDSSIALALIAGLALAAVAGVIVAMVMCVPRNN